MASGDNKKREKVRSHLSESATVKLAMGEQCCESIISAAELLVERIRGGGKVLLCGNGGSAADCQHMAAELVSRMTREIDRPGLPAIALTTDTSFLTAFANDYGYDGVFSRQVEALGRQGDVLIGISTSGNSSNVVFAFMTAKSMGMKTVALIGQSGRLKDLADVAISVPSANTQYIQEAHLAVEHLLCHFVEHELFSPAVDRGVSGPSYA